VAEITKTASALLIVSGMVLVSLNLLGFVLGVSVIDENIGQSYDAIPGYSYQIQDISMLHNMLEKPIPHFDLENVNNTIFESIIHSDNRRIQIYENWLLWFGGKIYAPLGRTQTPHRIVAGEGGLCSEVSAVMNSVAKINGYRARLIGLNGHVVSEVLTDDGWRVADPDYGVTYPVSIEILESEEGSGLIKKRLQNRGYKDETIKWYIKLFQSSEDNTLTEVGAALSPRLYAIEKASEILKWVIPMVTIIFGIIISKKTHKREALKKLP